MTVLTPLLLIVLAQAPASPGGPARYTVTVEMHGGVWGSATETDGSCPGAAPGSDTLTGIVTGTEPALFIALPCNDPDFLKQENEADEEDVVYTGVLTRTTSVDLCEVKDTSDGDKWCLGHLNGGGPVEVTILVPRQCRDNETLRVKMRPVPMAWAKAIGACSTLDNAELEAQYRSEDSIYFETSEDPKDRVPRTGRLFVGTSKRQERTPPKRPAGEYTLKVEKAP